MEVNTEEMYKVIGENIYRFRVLERLSQAKLAEKSNVSAAYISQIEGFRLHKGITCTAVIKIAESLQVPVCTLFAKEICPKYSQCLEKATSFSQS